MSAVRDTDRGYAGWLRRLREVQSIDVLVGVRASGDEPDLALIATWNEFGTTRAPERSFLRSTIEENRSKYIEALGKAVTRVIEGGSARVAYGRIGQMAVRDVQRKIRSNVPPPNAPSTIARKGSSRTLVDTGRLRQSIDYTIEGLGALGAA